ncbi:uncharacterized protein LOC129282442 isoform X2 [Lytechinus pictus]|uniref:uncharacterized protein LOC129282442 isoform X2 n=1 Tax=Lytechinus pictus TaxID=7653 RepID=UPI0030B9DCC7
MNRFLVLLVVLSLVLGLVTARSEPRKNKGKNKEGGRRERKGNNEAATTQEEGWIWSECVPNAGSCGKGQKIGNCTGELCEVPAKTVDCRVRCVKETDTTEAVIAGDGEEAVNATAAPAKGRGKGRRPGKDGRGKGNNNEGTENGRRPEKGGRGKGNKTEGTENGRRPEKPSRGNRKPNKNDKPAKTKDCNYTMGEFGPCNETTNLRTRLDTLTDPTETSDECSLLRTVEEKCRRSEGRDKPVRCRYNWDQPPTCDESTNKINMTGSLVSVEGAPADCEATKTHEVHCKKAKVPCKLGEWGEFSDCIDGMKTRTRKLQKGPHYCHRLIREVAACE